MPEFPPVFVQKIFCFVQIPESFVQKRERTTGETERNLEENFLKAHRKRYTSDGKAQTVRQKRDLYGQ